MATGSGIVDGNHYAILGNAATSFTVLDPSVFQVQGTTLTVQGTPGNDTFTFTAGSPEQVSLNGARFPIDAAAITTIHFVSNGGSDSATLTGLGGDHAALSPTFVSLSGTGYTVDAANCGSVTVNSSGNATADFGLTATGPDLTRHAHLQPSPAR